MIMEMLRSITWEKTKQLRQSHTRVLRMFPLIPLSFLYSVIDSCQLLNKWEYLCKELLPVSISRRDLISLAHSLTMKEVSSQMLLICRCTWVRCKMQSDSKSNISDKIGKKEMLFSQTILVLVDHICQT